MAPDVFVAGYDRLFKLCARRAIRPRGPLHENSGSDVSAHHSRERPGRHPCCGTLFGMGRIGLMCLHACRYRTSVQRST
jgi:hypothetical protein